MTTTQPYSYHLLVLVHGRLGGKSEDHLSQVPLAIAQSEKFVILKTDLSGSNGRAYNNVDLEAEKVVQEVCLPKYHVLLLLR